MVVITTTAIRNTISQNDKGGVVFGSPSFDCRHKIPAEIVSQPSFNFFLPLDAMVIGGRLDFGNLPVLSRRALYVCLVDVVALLHPGRSSTAWVASDLAA